MMFEHVSARGADLHGSSTAIGSPHLEIACDIAASHAMERALASLATPHVHLASRVISPVDLTALHPVERATIERAVPTRQHEFATGRALLRSLLGVDVAIPVGADRAPVLPPGVRASLAHDRSHAVAALSRSVAVRSIGIDIEPTTTLSTEMADVILRVDEAGIDAHLAFALKEATYKAWSRLGGRMLEFHEVRLLVGADRFEAEVLPTGDRFAGRYVQAGDRWVALVVCAGDA